MVKRISVLPTPEIWVLINSLLERMPVHPPLSALCQVALERGLREIEKEGRDGFAKKNQG